MTDAADTATPRPEVPPGPLQAGVTRSGAARLDGIDALRGLVIVIMVLDHVRDFFHRTAFTADPLAIEGGDPALFLTRWITHLCAPTFVFLAGVSIWLQRANGKPDGALTRFLLTRGLWLIVLELTLVTVGFNFGWFGFLQVIWAIGASMVAMAALIRLPRQAVLALGVAIVAGHQALAPVDPPDLGAAGPLWAYAMEFGPTPGMPGFLAYPFVPWLGIMMAGYGLGDLFRAAPRRRTRGVLVLCAVLLAAFVVIRGLNGYGDPRPWAVQDTPLWTALSFIDVAKYPPSLDYVLATLGLSLATLPLLERLGGPVKSALLTFGRTPLFTYLVHVWLAHALALVVGVIVGVPASAFFNLLGDPSRALDAGWGFGLLPVYGFWLLTLALLWPLSRAFERFKARRRDWWLGYL